MEIDRVAGNLRLSLLEQNKILQPKGPGLIKPRSDALELDRRLRREQRVGRITDIAEKALSDAENSGKVEIDAGLTAEKVVEALVGQAEAVNADEIIREHQDALILEKGPDWDEEIRARFMEQFRRDGTFDRAKRDVLADKAKLIADELKTEVTG